MALREPVVSMRREPDPAVAAAGARFTLGERVSRVRAATGVERVLCGTWSSQRLDSELCMVHMAGIGRKTRGRRE